MGTEDDVVERIKQNLILTHSHQTATPVGQTAEEKFPEGSFVKFRRGEQTWIAVELNLLLQCLKLPMSWLLRDEMLELFAQTDKETGLFPIQELAKSEVEEL